MSNNLKWCVRLKDGLKFIKPDELISKSYMQEAKASLKRAQTNFAEKDLLWATVVIYYAEYYALYSFLQKIGIKCGNHTCSILAAEKLLGAEKIKIINDHKTKRIDAQYYMKIGKEGQVVQMLQEAKSFVAEFDSIVSNITNSEIEKYRNRLKMFLR